jgi:multiple sugar transport system substrate-binding protein
MTSQIRKFDRRTVLKGGLAGAAGIGLGLYSPYVHAQNKTLSLMVLGPNQDAIKWLNSALAGFKAKSGYDVEVRQSDWGSGFQKLLTAAASATVADVTMMGQLMTPALASKGAFLPIDDRLANWPDTPSSIQRC